MSCRRFLAMTGLWLLVTAIALECNAGAETSNSLSGPDFRELLTSLEQPGDDPRHQPEEPEAFYRRNSMALGDSSSMGKTCYYPGIVPESPGNFKAAYVHARRPRALKDSILREEAVHQSSFRPVLYETENKEREIQLLRKEQELNALHFAQQNISLEKTRLQVTILLFSLIISILAGIIVVSRTRQKRRRMIVAEKLNYQKEQLKAILKTQEEERIRFARDLHDGLGQLLTALKINVCQLAQNQNGSMAASGEAAKNLIREMHQEIRNISFNIMPQVLVQKGLWQALEELAHKINTAGSHTISVSIHGVTHRFEPVVEIAIYRIIQELLNNIFKYSNARQVNIQLTQHHDLMNIHLEDDGLGFDTTLLENARGSGWKNICSRLRFIDGSIEYDSKPNRKFSTVIIDVPIK